MRDGAAVAAAVPAVWPERLTEGWAVEVGEGYATPVVADGRVYVVYVHARRDPDEVVLAFDLETGRQLWSDVHPAPFTKNSYAGPMAKGPNATPLLTGGRLITFGASAVLSAYDIDTGAVLWRHDYTKDIDTSKLFCGTAMSPLLVGDAVIVHVGDDRGGVFRSFDVETGALRWEQPGPGPGYASPVLTTFDGVAQVVTMTDSSVVGLVPEDGRLLWSYPFPDEWNENIVTPVAVGDVLVVSGTRRGTYGLKIARDGETWKAVEAWHSPETAMYMSSPVLHDGLLYTGETAWATEGREAGNAHLVAAGGSLVAQLDSGETIVAPFSTDDFAIARRYATGTSATYTHPVLTRQGILVRDATHLRLWNW
jgi:outer membrane protein assembly factor BamB